MREPLAKGYRAANGTVWDKRVGEWATSPGPNSLSIGAVAVLVVYT